MTAMLPLERVEVASPCGYCGMATITTISTHDGRAKVLDITPCAGGQYRLDSKGRAVPRSGLDQLRELRTGSACKGGGYNAHNCRPAMSRP